MGKAAKQNTPEDPIGREVDQATVPDNCTTGSPPEASGTSSSAERSIGDSADRTTSKKTKKSDKARRKQSLDKAAAGPKAKPKNVVPATLPGAQSSSDNASSDQPSSLAVRLRKKSLEHSTNEVAIADSTQQQKHAKKHQNSLSVGGMAAQDIPVPTDLRRQEQLPGAIHSAGIGASDNAGSLGNLAEQAQPPTGTETPAVEPPLLQATLVVEKEDENHDVEQAKGPVTPIVAELMEDDDDKAGLDPPASRRRIYCLMGLLILVLIAAGAVVAVLALGTDSGSGSGDSSQSTEDPEPDGDDGGEDDGGVVEQSNIHRAYYFVEYGYGQMGCEGLDLKLELTCAQSELLVLRTDNAECDLLSDSNGRSVACRVTNKGGLSGGSGRLLQYDLPQGAIHEAGVLVACEGEYLDTNEAAFVLEGTVKKRKSPMECSHTLYEQQNPGTFTSSRVIGGVTASAATFFRYSEKDGEVVLHEETLCDSRNQQRGFEEDIDMSGEPITTIYCGGAESCVEVRDNCRNNNDPCSDVTCSVSGEKVSGSFANDPYLVHEDVYENDPAASDAALWAKKNELPYASPSQLVEDLMRTELTP